MATASLPRTASRSSSRPSLNRTALAVAWLSLAVALVGVAGYLVIARQTLPQSTYRAPLAPVTQAAIAMPDETREAQDSPSGVTEAGDTAAMDSGSEEMAAKEAATSEDETEPTNPSREDASREAEGDVSTAAVSEGETESGPGTEPAVSDIAPGTAAPETPAPETAPPEATTPEMAGPETTDPETAARETDAAETDGGQAAALDAQQQVASDNGGAAQETQEVAPDETASVETDEPEPRDAAATGAETESEPQVASNAEAPPAPEPPAMEKFSEDTSESAGPSSDTGPQSIDKTADESMAQDDPVADDQPTQRVDIPIEPLWRQFATAVELEPGRPSIAVVVAGLGLSASATESAIRTLPAHVTLSFSPYSRRLNEWIALARVDGHEVMLDLPMEPVGYPNLDPGPHTLLTSLTAKENLEHLNWVLQRANSYVGVATMMGSRFSASEQHLLPIMKELDRRGILYLDNRSIATDAPQAVSRQLGAPLLINDRTIDETQASRVAIDSRLAQIERIALDRGTAVAMGQPFPVTIERLRDWTSFLEGRGFTLVPITALVPASPAG